MTALYPALRAAMILPSVRDPRAAERLHKALGLLDQLEADAVITNAEHAALKSSINRSFEIAWTSMVREPFFHDGRWQALSAAEQKLENSIGLSPECHRAAGMLAKVEKAESAAGLMRDAMLIVLREAAPLGERVTALKAKIGKRAPKPTKTSMARAERDAKAMTCQVCGRGILAEEGLIAHHGYQRPGEGRQTASCPGARHLPFEVSCETLRKHVDLLQRRYDRLGMIIDRAVKGDGEIVVDLGSKLVGRVRTPIRTTVTRATFDAVKAEREIEFRAYGIRDFEAARSRRESALRRERGFVAESLRVQGQRLAGWKQTHVRVGGEWTPVDSRA